MPCFNSAKTIEQSIRSVLNQDYTNWELLIVDDSSHDNSASLIDDFLNIISSEFAIISNSTFSFWARAFSSIILPETKTWGPRFWRPTVARKLKLYN